MCFEDMQFMFMHFMALACFGLGKVYDRDHRFLSMVTPVNRLIKKSFVRLLSS